MGSRRKTDGAAEQGLPRRQMSQERPAPIRIEFGEDIVEQQDRWRAGGFGDHPMGGQTQRQRQRSLLPLRGMGPLRHPVDGQEQFVAMGSDQ